MSDRHGVQPALSHDASGITSDSRRPASGPDRASQTVSGALEEQERKPVRCAKFRQQELWAWKPVWSPTAIVIMYLIVAVIFIPLGIVIFVQSTRLYSSPFLRYDERCRAEDGTTGSECDFTVEVTKDVEAPSYFYYGLVNFYQNARTYVSSRSDQQLRGANNPDTSECAPLENEIPCGLIANSFFQDTFEIRDSDENPVSLKKSGIAWSIDKNKRFVGSGSYSSSVQDLITDEDFMVWMRVAAYRSWKKLYRIIDEDLTAGNYTVRINSRYDVESFDGKKFFFISETTWFGGPNQALGIGYLVVGAVASAVSIFFGIRSRMAMDLDLPPETTVYLDGLVKHPVKPQGHLEKEQETV